MMNETQRSAIHDCIEMGLQSLQDYCREHPELRLAGLVQEITDAEMDRFLVVLNGINDRATRTLILHLRKLAIGEDFNVNYNGDVVVGYVLTGRRPFNLGNLGPPLPAVGIRNYIIGFIGANPDLINPPAAEPEIVPVAVAVGVVGVAEEGNVGAGGGFLRSYGPMCAGFLVQMMVRGCVSPAMAGAFSGWFGKFTGGVLEHAATGAIAGGAGGAVGGAIEGVLLKEDTRTILNRAGKSSMKSATVGACIGAMEGVIKGLAEGDDGAEDAGEGPSSPAPKELDDLTQEEVKAINKAYEDLSKDASEYGHFGAVTAAAKVPESKMNHIDHFRDPERLKLAQSMGEEVHGRYLRSGTFGDVALPALPANLHFATAAAAVGDVALPGLDVAAGVQAFASALVLAPRCDESIKAGSPGGEPSLIRQRLNKYAEEQRKKEAQQAKWKSDLKARLATYGKAALVVAETRTAETGGTVSTLDS